MKSTETPEVEAVTKTKLDLVFLGADGFPIDGLKGRVVVDGEEMPFETNASGATNAMQVAPDAEVKVHVMRMDGSYKEIQSCEASHVDACWSFISPSIVFEATTQLHRGEPGTVAQEIPNWESGDEGERDKGKESIAGAAPFEDGFTSTQVVPGVTSTAAKPSVSAAPPEAAAPKYKKRSIPDPIKAKSAEAAKATKAEGRDASGNPMVVFTHKVKDWWGSWHFPMWSLSWGAKAATPTAGDGQASGASGAGYNAGMEKQVKALIDFAKRQATYDYPDSSTSASIIASLKNNTFEAPNIKEANKPKGHCYKHVKVALAYAGIVDGVVADGAPLAEQKAASMAGPSLILKGFREVTNEVPDARWAAAGDVITYEWSTKTWGIRKKTYGENCLNYGHIDIRDYESYISDFIAPPPAHHPTWVRNIHTPSAYLEYVNIKIFRKVYDPMPTLHIKAFLRCLQYCETLGAESSKLYRLNRGAPPYTYFEGFGVHPAHSMAAGLARDNVTAGAYQIQYRTWKDVMDSNILQLPSNSDKFSPIIQDRIAVVLIEEKNALHLVRTAQMEEAIRKLQGIWTSLPGAGQNVAGRTMEKFKSNFEQFLEEEKKKVGIK